MVGEDLTSASSALPPRPIGPPPTQAQLAILGRQLSRAAGQLGFLERWFWGEGVCLLAMLRLPSRVDRAAQDGQSEVGRFFQRYVDLDPVVDHVNSLAPAAAAAEVWMRNHDPRLLELVQLCLRWYENSSSATRAADGTLEHWPGGIWADTAYMAGSFLLRTGVALERADLIDEAVTQWLRHAEHLADPETGLIAHGTHQGQSNRCWWGRANAWMALAGVDLLDYAGDHPAAGMVRKRLHFQLGALTDRQPNCGVWDVLVDGQAENRGVLETSAAAGIGAAMLRLTRHLPDALSPGGRSIFAAGQLAARAALSYVDDGRLTRVSAGTVLQLVPFGYSVIRDDRPQPWGQGLAIEACAALLTALNPDVSP